MSNATKFWSVEIICEAAMPAGRLVVDVEAKTEDAAIRRGQKIASEAFYGESVVVTAKAGE